jgi:UPF0755 protein
VSDDLGRGYPGDDPFVDQNDPEAVERAERRREREEKRASKRGKKAQKPAPPPPKPAPLAPPTKPRTPEQEFWDEPAEPATPPPLTPQPPVPGQEAATPAPPPLAPDPEEAKGGRRRLFGRRKKAAAAGAAGAAAAAGGAASAQSADASAASGASAPGGTPAAKEPPTATGESTGGEQPTAIHPASSPEGTPVADPGPPTAEQPMPKQPDDNPNPPTGESAPPSPEQPSSETERPGTEPPSGETSRPGAEPPSSETSRPGAEPPSGETAAPGSPTEPPSGESARPGAEPPSGETARPATGPPTDEAPHAGGEPPSGETAAPGSPEAPATGETEHAGPPTAETPRRDPGDVTADSPQLDPNRPGSAAAVPGDAAGPSTREHRAQPTRPVDEIGAGDWEAPPPRGDDWFDTGEEPFHDEGDPKMAGAARSGRRHGDDHGRRGGIVGALLGHPFRILGVIVLIVILLFLNALFQPFGGSGHGRKVVTIPKGSSVGEVGDLLEKEGVISSGFVISGSTLFQARVTIAGKRSELHAGKYVMKEGMSYGDAIDELSKEPKVAAKAKPGVITLTIPEGQSRPITAKLLKEDDIKGNYLKASKKSKILNPAEYGGKGAKNLEGFLFPDTWEFRTNKPVKDLVALQLEDFKKKIKQVNMKYAKSKNLTVYDVVTIASMIEREAGVPKQRKLVASVIYNRLHEGMTLGIDSTIRFATGNYEKPLTQSELESESPYNTRTHAGLPPGPINSPGLAALNAAAHPAKTNFLFYVNNPNSCDELTFSKNEEEFLANAEKYEKAREKNGGNEPSTCK